MIFYTFYMKTFLFLILLLVGLFIYFSCVCFYIQSVWFSLGKNQGLDPPQSFKPELDLDEDHFHFITTDHQKKANRYKQKKFVLKILGKWKNLPNVSPRNKKSLHDSN